MISFVFSKEDRDHAKSKLEEVTTAISELQEVLKQVNTGNRCSVYNVRGIESALKETIWLVSCSSSLLKHNPPCDKCCLAMWWMSLKKDLCFNAETVKTL